MDGKKRTLSISVCSEIGNCVAERLRYVACSIRTKRYTAEITHHRQAFSELFYFPPLWDVTRRYLTWLYLMRMLSVLVRKCTDLVKRGTGKVDVSVHRREGSEKLACLRTKPYVVCLWTCERRSEFRSEIDLCVRNIPPPILTRSPPSSLIPPGGVCGMFGNSSEWIKQGDAWFPLSQGNMLSRVCEWVCAGMCAKAGTVGMLLLAFATSYCRLLLSLSADCNLSNPAHTHAYKGVDLFFSRGSGSNSSWLRCRLSQRVPKMHHFHQDFPPDCPCC